MPRRRHDETPVDLAAACAERGCKRPHQHGESRTEGTHACPCRPCRSARWRREQRRAHARHRGTALPQYVPAGDVVAHIATLRATGATLGAIAEAAGVSRDTVGRLGAGAGRRVQPAIAQRILAVRTSDIDGTGTSIGAHRRLQALAALGWSSAQIAAAAGMHQRVVLKYTTDGEHIRTPARRLIVAVHSKLWNQQPPTATAGQRAAVTYQRNKAARLGWVVTAAWDDIDHDTAPADTGPDPVRGRPGSVHPDDIGWMLRCCGTSWEAAERLGVSREHLLYLAAKYEIPIPAHIRVGDADRTQALRERRAA